MNTIHPNYITSEDGTKISVVLPIQEFESLLEDLADLSVVAERKNEPTIPHSEVVASLAL
jgi:hypothetical protein